jgi:hypothetical protein
VLRSECILVSLLWYGMSPSAFSTRVDSAEEEHQALENRARRAARAREFPAAFLQLP